MPNLDAFVSQGDFFLSIALKISKKSIKVLLAML